MQIPTPTTEAEMLDTLPNDPDRLKAYIAILATQIGWTVVNNWLTANMLREAENALLDIQAKATTSRL
jgi:hypothetical protein